MSNGAYVMAEDTAFPTDSPETAAQAAEWDRKKGQYIRAGLCHQCAAQAAWGHQLGFQRVHPPCQRCVRVVVVLPQPGVNGWRKLPRGRLRSDLTWSSTRVDSRPTPQPTTASDGRRAAA